MNLIRIAAVISPDNPDIENLCELVMVGTTIHLPPGFQPNSARPRDNLPKLGKLYSSAAVVVNKMKMEHFHGQRLAFVVSKATALSIPETNFSPFEWAPTDGKRQGRLTTNASGAGPNNMSLYDKMVKEACDKQWGHIKHPTIAQIAQMMNELISEEHKKPVPFDIHSVEDGPPRGRQPHQLEGRAPDGP